MSRTATGPALRPAEFVPLIALLMSLVALAIDAMLPALPAIGRDLEAPRPNDVQFVITSLFLGLGLGQMLFGPLSDRIGRRPRHPCRPRPVHDRVPREHLRTHLRDDDRGACPARHRGGGAAHRDRGPCARPVRRTADGPPDVLRDGRVHPRSHRRSGSWAGHPLAGKLASDIHHVLRHRRHRLRVVCAPPAGNPARRAPATLLGAGHRPGRGRDTENPGCGSDTRLPLDSCSRPSSPI